MDTMLTDLSTPSLAQAVQSNFIHFFLSLKPSSAAQLHTEPGLNRWHTRVPHRWYNGVAAARPPVGDETLAIQSALEYFQAQEVRRFDWRVEPGTSLEAWGRRLEPFGFQFEKGIPGMAVDLQVLPQGSPMPPGLRIVRVAGSEPFRDWARTLEEGFEMPEGWEAAYTNLFIELGFTHPFRFYLGYLGDMPVATSMLFLGAGVAGLYNVSTVHEARSRGLGTALTIAALKEARDEGYRVGILQASKMGYPVYERLGFKKVCDMEHYYWADS